LQRFGWVGSAQYRFGAPGARGRAAGVPHFTADRGFDPADSPLIASRAPSGHTPEDDAGLSTGPPSWAFAPLQRFQSRGFGQHGCCPTRHLPPSAFRTLPAVCSPRPLPGLFRPGNAPGVPSSGPLSSREARRLSRGRCPPAVRPTGPDLALAGSIERATRGFRAFASSRRVRTRAAVRLPGPLPS